LSNIIIFGIVPTYGKKKLKNVDAKFQVEVRYWAFTNHLQDYKIYGIVIEMFKTKFLFSFLQQLGNNPWLAD
jgi:hypothetical protein